jgi:hypothetical protein
MVLTVKRRKAGDSEIGGVVWVEPKAHVKGIGGGNETPESKPKM